MWPRGFIKLFLYLGIQSLDSTVPFILFIQLIQLKEINKARPPSLYGEIEIQNWLIDCPLFYPAYYSFSAYLDRSSTSNLRRARLATLWKPVSPNQHKTV